MTSDQDIIKTVVDFYINSRDFNGLPLSHLEGNKEKLVCSISSLVKSGDVVVNFGDRHQNIHILALEPEPIDVQLEKIKNRGLNDTCLYPTRKSLKDTLNDNEFLDRPYTRLLRIGEPQLAYRYFELSILESYRNDPSTNLC